MFVLAVLTLPLHRVLSPLTIMQTRDLALAPSVTTVSLAPATQRCANLASTSPVPVNLSVLIVIRLTTVVKLASLQFLEGVKMVITVFRHRSSNNLLITRPEEFVIRVTSALKEKRSTATLVSTPQLRVLQCATRVLLAITVTLMVVLSSLLSARLATIAPKDLRRQLYVLRVLIRQVSRLVLRKRSSAQIAQLVSIATKVFTIKRKSVLLVITACPAPTRKSSKAWNAHPATFVRRALNYPPLVLKALTHYLAQKRKTTVESVVKVTTACATSLRRPWWTVLLGSIVPEVPTSRLLALREPSTCKIEQRNLMIAHLVLRVLHVTLQEFLTPSERCAHLAFTARRVRPRQDLALLVHSAPPQVLVSLAHKVTRSPRLDRPATSVLVVTTAPLKQPSCQRFARRAITALKVLKSQSDVSLATTAVLALHNHLPVRKVISVQEALISTTNVPSVLTVLQSLLRRSPALMVCTALVPAKTLMLSLAVVSAAEVSIQRTTPHNASTVCLAMFAPVEQARLGP